MKIPASELRLANTVRLTSCEGFDTAAVKQLESTGPTQVKVTFFRPYISTADFAYTGGVICYIGIEEWAVTASHAEMFEVLERKVIL